jgi:TonB family protein
LKTCALLLCCCLALASARVQSQEMLSYQQRIDRLDRSLREARRLDEQADPASRATRRDLRDVAAAEDIRHWAMTPDVLDRVANLVAKARAAAPEQDHVALDEADDRMGSAVRRVMEIHDYWQVVPRISWRARWDAFASANGLEPDEISPDLLFEEKQLLEALEAGAFPAATRRTKAIEQLLADAMRQAIPAIVKRRKSEDLVFVARSNACAADKANRGTAGTRLVRPGDPDAWYPDGARTRGETGGIVLRARIAATSCATAFAVLVKSGYPELDAAALKVAEASRYKAAVESGKPRAGEIDFKVLFKIEDNQSRDRR